MSLKTFCNTIIVLAVAALGGISTNAQTSPDRAWHSVNEGQLGRAAQRAVSPAAYRTFRLDHSVMRPILASAPEEFSEPARFTQTILTLPMPDGTFGRFRIEHSLIVEPGLAEKYPELAATYNGRGIDDPTATVRLDLLPSGFHAMVLSPKGTVLVDPYAPGDTQNYITYFKRDVPRSSEFACKFEEYEFIDKLLRPNDKTSELIPDASNDVISGTQLRTYRLALAATNEYTATVGGNTIAGALAAEVLIMNRVNGVYERDVAIRMVMIANNNLITYAGDNMGCGGACNSGNDPYTNSNGGTMLGQNQTAIDTAIGVANYDIGHVFSTGGGGVASLAVPCGASKARGVTGLPNPVGDPFAIDYVAHEMGHQWSANHTFNGTSGSCGGGNRSNTNSYEPGSGITIMAYAGICGAQDLAANSIDTFHVRSLEAIVAFSQTGNGNTCANATATGNTPPSVSVVGGPSWNIPKQTPFTLTATGSDANGDTLTYDWQQFNNGSATGGGTTAVPNTDSDGIARPIFRPYLPISSPVRTYPSLQYILNNANVPPAQTAGFLTGELLPAITRVLTFQVVARDNRPNGGGINTATATLNVDGASGPFVVTAPNTGVTWAGNSSQTVTWDVANTSAAPVSAANVRILFSSDGGQTFPTTILASTPNDGTQTITVPNVATMQGRIKIEGGGNIFFDISDTNFTVTAGPSVSIEAPFDFDGDNRTDISIFRPSAGQWWYQQSSNGSVRVGTFGTSSDRLVPADFTGDNKTDLAFWRPSTGEWYFLRSDDLTFFAFPFGTNGDIPVPGNFDADGLADAAVFRPSNNTWYIRRSTGGTDFIGFGSAGDKPVVGDYDGDGRSDIAIFRPTGGSGQSEWWIRRSSDSVVLALQFGAATDKPVQGYYTADVKTDIAVWRPSSGSWFVLRSEDSSYYSLPFGTNGDSPAPGDYDGDGRFDYSVFRPSNNTWYIQRTSSPVLIQSFGSTGDVAVPSAYVP